MRGRGQRGIWTASALVVALACGDASEAVEEQGDEASAGTEEQGDEGETETGDEGALGDACVDTPLVISAPTILEASLRGATPAPNTIACEIDGPVVFVEVHVEDRVDLSVRARGRAYTPKLAVLRPGCGPVEDPERVLACAEALPATLLDIGPDIELLLAVAIAPDDPGLELPVPDLPELDPLDFELELDTRPVLHEGQLCGPSLGRCEAGTVCMEDALEGPEGPEPGDGLARCFRPPADSCVDPGALVLAAPGEVVEVTITPDEPHSDAHEHDCTGWRRPERVEALTLPEGLGPDARLELRASDPRVGLALRGPSCLPGDALACAPAILGAGPTTLSWGSTGELAALAEAGLAPLLFIELPRADSSADPIPTITVELEISD